jgi:hypothetical protein
LNGDRDVIKNTSRTVRLAHGLELDLHHNRIAAQEEGVNVTLTLVPLASAFTHVLCERGRGGSNPAKDVGSCFGRVTFRIAKSMFLTKIIRGLVDASYMRIIFSILLFLGLLGSVNAQTNDAKVTAPTPADEKKDETFVGDPTAQFQFVVVSYEGGSWEKSPQVMEYIFRVCVPRYLQWFQQQKYMAVNSEIQVLKLSDPRIFNYPFIYLAGHYKIKFTEEEIKNLKSFMERGGGVFFDDYGKGWASMVQTTDGKEAPKEEYFADQVETLLKSFYPDGEVKLLPKSHTIYKSPFGMPVRRPPHIKPEDYDPARDGVVQLSGRDQEAVGCRIYLNGFYVKDRIIAFYSNAGQCPEGSLIRTSDPNNQDRAFKLFTNMLLYMMTH